MRRVRLNPSTAGTWLIPLSLDPFLCQHKPHLAFWRNVCLLKPQYSRAPGGILNSCRHDYQWSLRPLFSPQSRKNNTSLTNRFYNAKPERTEAEFSAKTIMTLWLLTLSPPASFPQCNGPQNISKKEQTLYGSRTTRVNAETIYRAAPNKNNGKIWNIIHFMDLISLYY